MNSALFSSYLIYSEACGFTTVSLFTIRPLVNLCRRDQKRREEIRRACARAKKVPNEMSCPHADIKQDENTGRKYCHACGKEMDSVKDSKPKSDFIDTTLDMFSATEARLVTSEASEIGHIYQKAKASLIDSVVLLIECGERLKAQKDKLEHGQWLPWLEANRQELGFGERTARYLMDAASRPYSTNRKLTADLDETTALDISRQIWGNRESDLEPDDSIEMEPDDEPQPPEGSCERPSAEPETKHRPRRRHPSSIANQNIRAS